MRKNIFVSILGLIALLALAPEASARGPYIGFVYPAGGQQGTMVQVRLGGQRLQNVTDAVVSGEGVSAEVKRFARRLNNQDIQLLREQAKLLKKTAAQQTKAAEKGKGEGPKPQLKKQIKRIDDRLRSWTNRPACPSLAEIAYVEVTIDPDAKPGRREIRLIAATGLTNPMAFHVGQIPEVSRRAMITARLPVLGNEAAAQRKRPPEEEEAVVTVPCTMNGQIAAGEVNRYRFEAKKGQQLVVTVSARELVPYIADAVPGWFQPVLTLRNAAGREVAFSDDYRSKPDPTLYYEVAADGEYVLTIKDSIYRGREDFVYRITIGQLPFVTSIFPLGRRVGESADISMEGWNIEGAALAAPPKNAAPGILQLTATKDNFVTNAVPFAIDTLPECLDAEENNTVTAAQKVVMPIIVNGRVDQRDDWDVFAVEGKAGQRLVAEVQARRLDSPLDSILKLTDASGKLLAVNDDHGDPAAGMNTHHADSYIMTELPADGTYYVHIGDTGRKGGKEYAYRLRISRPRPDFELRVVPNDGGIRSKGGTGLTVFAIRKDGFEGNIRLKFKDPPEGFSSPWAQTLTKGTDSAKCGIKTTLSTTDAPVRFHIVGTAMIGKNELVREAVPAEDRMQAFLWRHLVPSSELAFLVYDPKAKPRRTRPLPEMPEMPKLKEIRIAKGEEARKHRLTLARVRQLNSLYEERLLTGEFYRRKMTELEESL